MFFDSEMNRLEYYIFNSVNNFSAQLYDMQYVEDGLVFAGKVNGQAVVIKTDFQFNVVWQSDPFWAMGQARSIEPYGDNWISLSGRVFTEINAVGDTLWTYYDPINYTSFWDCTVAADNSIYLLGFFKIWKVNTIEYSLDLIAENVPGGHDSYRKRPIDILPNGNIVYTGRSDTNQLLHSYSPDGVHQWSRSYDTLGAIYFGTGSKNLLVMPDGSILFCMHHGRMVLVKTDPEGNVVSNDDPVAPVAEAPIRAYPNPMKDEVTIKISQDDQSISAENKLNIFNIKGQLIHSLKLTKGETVWDGKDSGEKPCPKGIYLLRYQYGTGHVIKICKTS